jgi:mannose-6-phosphate isomerase
LAAHFHALPSIRVASGGKLLMGATSLKARPLPKIWGRSPLPEPLGMAVRRAGRIGEIWFDAPGEPELLVKYLFTSERLSIQVHPDDVAARALGLARGKDEAWLVLEAEPGAVIGLGLRRAVTREELRAAATGGVIEALIDWKPVRAGDFIYSPAGTIHAIGAGLTLVELQQHSDLTFRLYDYGRPRELHLDAALAAARLEPWHPIYTPRTIGEGRQLLATGGCFTVERWQSGAPLRFDAATLELVMVPLGGGAIVEGVELAGAGAASATGQGGIQPVGHIDLLVAYPGPVRLNLVTAERRRLVRRAGGSPIARRPLP